MKPLKKWFFLFVVSLGFVPLAHALDPVTVWYQPTPYPTQEVIDASWLNKTIVDGSVSIPHITDGWIGVDTFGGYIFTPGLSLYVGNTETSFRTYIKFGLDGLPENTTNTTLRLWSSQYWSRTPTMLKAVNGLWDGNMTWETQPDATLMSLYNAPEVDQWYPMDVTQTYGDWKNWEQGAGGQKNNGLRIDPVFPWESLDEFESSLSSFPTHRPALELTFVPSLELKMPLNNLHKWSVTTEIGGGGCNKIHGGHQGNGYFSIDFSGRGIHLEDDPYGDIPLTYLDPTVVDVPILAAAEGEVVVGAPTAGGDQTQSSSAGFYVHIEHQDTGIRTGYYHMKASPLVRIGDHVSQGQVLGYMGNTPTNLNMGVHLDFNVQYNESGKKEEEPLTRVIMEGKLLKSYQIDDCTDDTPSGESRLYYTSSNMMIP